MHEIAQGDIARVKVQGKFQDQEVEVLAVKVKKVRNHRKTTYRLATMWDEKYFPAWFDENEIEPVNLEGQIQ